MSTHPAPSPSSSVPVLWPLLAPLAWLFLAGSALRNALWDLGLRPVHRPRARVISVGGLMSGGSGKTPITLSLLHWLRGDAVSFGDAQGDTPLALVSRGYGRATTGPQVVSDGRRVLLSARDGGDEPVMMARALRAETGTGPGVPVIVAEDRVAGVRLAEERFGARVVVLDDAFSHRRIARDLDILVLNEDLPRWWWRPLPAGRLREWPGEWSRADFIVLHGSPARRRVRLFGETLAGDRVAFTSTRLDPRARTLDGSPVALAPGARLLAATAIARPERFVDALAGDYEVAGTFLLPDHAPWTPAQRRKAVANAQAAGADALAVTEKDAVKWPLESTALPVLVFRQDISWESARAIENGLPRPLIDRLRWVCATAPRLR